MTHWTIVGAGRVGTFLAEIAPQQSSFAVEKSFQTESGRLWFVRMMIWMLSSSDT